MPDNSDPSLRPNLDHAQHALEDALDEACGVDIRTADTGELIRVEEALETAARAAKDAVSLRLKRRTERQGSLATAPAPIADTKTEEHRVIQDPSGASWAVFSVSPSSRSVEQGTLPNSFTQGWLSFEHGDEIRRYAPAPSDWQTLTDQELLELWQKAEVSTKRITSLQTAEEKRTAKE